MTVKTFEDLKLMMLEKTLSMSEDDFNRFLDSFWQYVHVSDYLENK